MRSLLVVLLLALPMSAAAHQRLVTDSFEVTIDARCKEGTVGCENVLLVKQGEKVLVQERGTWQ